LLGAHRLLILFYFVPLASPSSSFTTIRCVLLPGYNIFLKPFMQPKFASCRLLWLEPKLLYSHFRAFLWWLFPCLCSGLLPLGQGSRDSRAARSCFCRVRRPKNRRDDLEKPPSTSPLFGRHGRFFSAAVYYLAFIPQFNSFVLPLFCSQDKNEVITESSAILSHLCRKFHLRPR
jgi:hypothetical protein